MKQATKDLKPRVGMVVEMRPYLNWGGLYTIMSVCYYPGSFHKTFLVFVCEQSTGRKRRFDWYGMLIAGVIIGYEQ